MIYPKQLDIEVTSRCNLACVGCPQTLQEGKGVDMDYELFKSIIYKLDFNCTIVPWLNGEPLLNPDYDAMVKLLNSRPRRYYVTTNGMIYRESVYRELFGKDTKCYQVIFSLDGLPCEFSRSIEVARPGSKRDTVLANIQKAFWWRAQSGVNVDIAVKIVERGQDWEEIEQYVIGWLRAGVDYVCVGKMLDRENVKSMRIYPCRYSDDMFMVIRADGEVVACPYNPVAHNDNFFAFGNVRDIDYLSTLYNNEKMSEFRENQRAGKFSGPCVTCGYAYTGDGFRGVISPRNPEYSDMQINYHFDYYNSFYSLKDKRHATSRYTYHARDEISRLYV